MFQTKICGIQNPKIAVACRDIGIDAIGLNFFAGSRRRVDPPVGKSIADAVGDSVLVVGLFVNHSLAEMSELVQRCSIQMLQLHGDEPPALLHELAGCPVLSDLPVIRAIRISPQSEDAAIRQIEKWSEYDRDNQLAGFLLDANQDGQYGGTGSVIDWNWLATIGLPDIKPIVLAGGLTPENVAEAISIVQPAGVDVAGGVESVIGNENRKDIGKIQLFFDQAHLSLNRN